MIFPEYAASSHGQIYCCLVKETHGISEYNHGQAKKTPST